MLPGTPPSNGLNSSPGEKHSHNNQVVVQDVTLGPINGTEQVVETGLDGGETIIVEGIQKVRAGMTVVPEPLQELASPQVEL